MKAWLLILALLPPLAAASDAATRRLDSYDHMFKKYSKRYFGVGWDWRIFKAQAMAESNMTPTAESRVGAKGLMQLMPSTFGEIQTKNPELQNIDDPEWNIAAGIYHDRQLWRSWQEHESDPDRLNFTFASYNAGRGYIAQAQEKARARGMDPLVWWSIEQVAAQVPRWRYRETLGYVQKITSNRQLLDDRGRVRRTPRS